MEIFRLTSKLLTGTGRKQRNENGKRAQKRKCTLLEKIFENNFPSY